MNEILLICEFLIFCTGFDPLELVQVAKNIMFLDLSVLKHYIITNLKVVLIKNNLSPKRLRGDL